MVKRRDERLRYAGHDRGDATRGDFCRRVTGAQNERLERHRPFIWRAIDDRREAPAHQELLAAEQARGDFGVADVESEQHQGESRVTMATPPPRPVPRASDRCRSARGVHRLAVMPCAVPGHRLRHAHAGQHVAQRVRPQFARRQRTGFAGRHRNSGGDRRSERIRIDGRVPRADTDGDSPQFGGNCSCAH